MNLIAKGICIYCRCTDMNACITEDGPCYWINKEQTICSACDQEQLAGTFQLEMEMNMNVQVDSFLTFSYFDQFMVPIIVVTSNTSDFPGKFVGRLFNLEQATPYCIISDSLEEIRKNIPPQFTRIQRDPNDDPVIVEVWL